MSWCTYILHPLQTPAHHYQMSEIDSIASSKTFQQKMDSTFCITQYSPCLTRYGLVSVVSFKIHTKKDFLHESKWSLHEDPNRVE